MTPEVKKQLEEKARDKFDCDCPFPCPEVRNYLLGAQSAWELMEQASSVKKEWDKLNPAAMELATQPYKCPLTGGDLTFTRATAELATKPTEDDERDAYYYFIGCPCLGGCGCHQAFLAGRRGLREAVQAAVEKERQRIVALLTEEKRLYQENSKQCDAGGNTFGGTLDCASASTCDFLISKILNPPKEEV